MKTLRAQLVWLFTTILVGCVPAWGQQEGIPGGAPYVSHQAVLFLPLGVNAAPVTGASLQVVGVPGQTLYCYWAVANYQIGSVLSALGCVNSANATLSGSNYDAIFPNVYPPGVTNVDFLRTSTIAPPSGACNCAVATGVTSGTVNDQSNSLSSYTVSLLNINPLIPFLDAEVTGAGAVSLMLRKGWPYNTSTVVANLSTLGGSGVTGSGTVGTFAGWTGTSAIGNAPCTFTATGMTCTIAQTSPPGNASLTLAGGAVAPPIAWELSDQQGNDIYDWQTATSGVTQHKGINVTLGVGGLGEFAVWATAAVMDLNVSNGSTLIDAFGLPVNINGTAAASTPALYLSGNLFTGGTGTSTWPYILANFPGAAQVTTWSTAGTIFGVDSPSGFAGNYIDFRNNGGSTPQFQISSSGLTNAAGGYQQNGTALGIGCGTTTTCAATAEPLEHIVRGNAPLVSGTPSIAAVTGIAPAFTSTTTYDCTASNYTTQANNIKVTKVSGSAVTFTGPNTVTDVVGYVCAGN